jgi:oligopeptide/dipeptide ABC transporter ATP-binding protein
MSVLLEVKNLTKHFHTPRGELHAVDGVSFRIEQAKTLGVVGESGCGKSTLGRLILHLTPITDGQVLFDGRDITNAPKNELKELRKNMQMIFQDPFSSLNPRMSISEIISEPLQIYGMCKDRKELEKAVLDMMDTVGLAQRLKYSYPHELDGGRRQRIGVARSLVLNPKLIVCDEPVSALDVSIQAQILNLIQDLQKERKLTYIFITHNLSVVKHISNDICVMYLGKVMEKTDSESLFRYQYHPYTKALLSAIPKAKLKARKGKIILRGEITSPINLGPGCRFVPRCIYAKDSCAASQPELREVGANHFVACHFVDEINGIPAEGRGSGTT